MKIKLILFSILLLYAPYLFSQEAETLDLPEESASTTQPDSPTDNSTTEPETPPGPVSGEAAVSDSQPAPFSKNILLAQDLALILPAFNIPEDFFSPDFGGSIVCEIYALNKLPGKTSTLPGLVLGLTGSAFLNIPLGKNYTEVKNSAMFHAGIYGGYQFLFTLPGNTAFSPALYAGMKYYFSYFPDNTVYNASNPLFLGGMTANFHFQNEFCLGLLIEYQLYFEGWDDTAAQTIQFGLRTGLLL